MMTALGPLLASFIAMDVAALKRRVRRNAIFYGIAAVLLLTTYVLLVAALAVYLGGLWGTPMALLVMAGGALVLALIMVACVAIANGVEAKRKRQVAVANSNRALAMTAAVSALPLLMKSKPLMLLAAVGGLGFLAMKGGVRPRQGPPPAE
jgi:ABC-type Na+ efflux pump permease subunit